ncbi:S8 family peptidase [Cohnella panacarvi]|uniref:S8 family peptidase n=1 Tax=Cohnella panacarvi TaxID=400776 RepID=UPI0004BC3AE6|nr:S8 family serine peptidase [Cohnella panacarvi]
MVSRFLHIKYILLLVICIVTTLVLGSDTISNRKIIISEVYTSTGLNKELNGLYTWPLDLINGRNIISLNQKNIPLIAVIDSGIDLNNKFLCSSCIKQITLENTPSSVHGTLVTGLITANGDGVITPRGILPNANILSIDVGSESGISIDRLIEAINLAVVNKAKIINISLTTKTDSDELRIAIENAISSGVIIIAAAGNDGENENDFPGRYKDVIAVSALTKSGFVDSRSNYSAGNIAAPGSYLLTTGSTTNGMDWFSGTSAATPLVSAAVAIILSISPDLKAEDIKSLLIASATKKKYGNTSINILNIKAATNKVDKIKSNGN